MSQWVLGDIARHAWKCMKCFQMLLNFSCPHFPAPSMSMPSHPTCPNSGQPGDNQIATAVSASSYFNPWRDTSTFCHLALAILNCEPAQVSHSLSFEQNHLPQNAPCNPSCYHGDHQTPLLYSEQVHGFLPTQESSSSGLVHGPTASPQSSGVRGAIQCMSLNQSTAGETWQS